jgi:hypothetical protein
MPKSKSTKTYRIFFFYFLFFHFLSDCRAWSKKFAKRARLRIRFPLRILLRKDIFHFNQGVFFGFCHMMLGAWACGYAEHSCVTMLLEKLRILCRSWFYLNFSLRSENNIHLQDCLPRAWKDVTSSLTTKLRENFWLSEPRHEASFRNFSNEDDEGRCIF